MHSVIVAMPLSYYPLGAQIMTLVLPLGFFILVMTVLYFVFATPHTIPGRRPIAGARPVAPAGAGRAASLAAATGLPTATAAGVLVTCSSNNSWMHRSLGYSAWVQFHCTST